MEEKPCKYYKGHFAYYDVSYINYRPISLTCVACKILEHIIHSHVMKHFARHDVLTDCQHGFRAKRSTETQLICTINDITNAIQCNKTVHAAVLDFSKAFDKVPHRRLLTKLEYYGIHGTLLDWFESFLTQRNQAVVYEGVSSSPAPIISGELVSPKEPYWVLCYSYYT